MATTRYRASLNAFSARNLGLSGGIDAAAMLYCVFPLESSAERNKKAVQCTADFVLLTHCFVQARQCVLKTKATLASGFLVALCARDSGGIRTHDPQLRRLLLYPAELRNHPLNGNHTLYFTHIAIAYCVTFGVIALQK